MIFNIIDLGGRESDMTHCIENYTSRIVVFCDTCGHTDIGEYFVNDAMESLQRLEVARAHLRTQKWVCSDEGDFCPSCSAARAA